jgi:DNA-binding NarL/FixJ family response regulator
MPAVKRLAARTFPSRPSGFPRGGGGADGARMGTELGTPPRQLEVLTPICLGMPNMSIARQFGMRETTVKAHVMQMMRRLEAEDRSQVMLYTAKLGFAAAPAAED